MLAKEKSAVSSWAGQNAFDNLQEIKVLVIGAGGLGCEILKNLAECGFRNIHIIDMDTIDLTNLNRQFLFREDDIGKFKASVAADKISQRSMDCSVTSHVSKIQDSPDSFYKQFHIVICGLDNVEARRWINAKLVYLCRSDPSAQGLRPLIDGGSEGFRGQARVILPTITACYECTLSLLLSDAATNYPLCTVASVPRSPEHCIQWASMVKWPQVFGNKVPDFDNIEDMKWLYEQARERAATFNISGVDLELVYGVSKRIIPAVASTNAVIAGSCCLEALKLATGQYAPIDNYFMYAGDAGIFTSVFKFDRNDDCTVCGENNTFNINADPDLSLKQSLQNIIQSHNSSDDLMNDLPSITTAQGSVLYMAHPAGLQQQTAANLDKKLIDISPKDSTEFALTHRKLPYPVRVCVVLKNNNK